MRPSHRLRLLAAVTALATGAAPFDVSAQGPRIQQGQLGTRHWLAQSAIVGAGSTATLASGGSAFYVAPMPQYSGVVALRIIDDVGDPYVCTGSLLPDRVTVLTAAHCLTGQVNAASVSAHFYGGSNPDLVVVASPDATVREASSWTVHPDYLGTDVIDQNDVAVVHLAQRAPSWAHAYDLDFTPLTLGLEFNVAGYGSRSSIGGSVGANLGSGRLRQGNNRFEFRWGDPMFYDWYTDGGYSPHSWVSDFDNGDAANDAACGFTWDWTDENLPYCDLGDALEVMIAGGDSGGPEFVGGRIAAVTSYYLTWVEEWWSYDYHPGLNASFGEFGGYVPMYLHQDFLRSYTVAEPGALALLAPGLLGLAAVRRRRRHRRRTAR